MSEPAVGQTAPALELPATGGATVRVPDPEGRWVVLYFYPKANTPGCTREGQAFRDLYPELQARGAEVIGASRDSVKAQEGFKAKHELPFPLLSDRDETACRAYGVLKERTLYGKRSIGIERSTFLIDPRGVLRREWRGVKVDGHAQAVLEALDELQGAE